MGAEDLKPLEGAGAQQGGLLSVVGALSDFDEWDESVAQVMEMRSATTDRRVDLE